MDSHDHAADGPQDNGEAPTQDLSLDEGDRNHGDRDHGDRDHGDRDHGDKETTPEKEGSKATSEIALGRGSGQSAGEGNEVATIDIPVQFTQTGYGTISSEDLPGKPAEKALPNKVGKYRLIRELGRGAFGVVYLGKDDDIDRLVAIKLSLVEDADYQRRLMVEASKVAKVAGKHIVQVLHVDRTDFGAVYIVQQYIEGCTLGTLIRSKTSISPGQAAILIYQLAIGLKSAHERDVLHRDLKPENILLQNDGTPYIVDFGIAISEEEQLGRNREIAGTPPFMSPEQIKGRVDFMDARSDIWALGVIFYELLTGKMPFTGRTSKELKEQICQRDPKPVHQYSPDTLSEDFDAVFRKCCAKKPSDRYATVDELAEAMLQLIQQHATIEDVDNPLGLDFEGKRPATSRVSRNREIASLLSTGLETKTSSKRQTHTDSLQGTVKSMTATVADQRKSYALQIATAIAAAVIVALVFLVADAMRSDPEESAANQDELAVSPPDVSPDPLEPAPESVDPADEIFDPELVEYDPDDGAVRLVATTGPANHRTIQAAIDASSSETIEVISIAPGFYRESLTFKKPIRLVAADPENKPEIVGSGDALITVDCDGGLAQIENLTLTGNAFYPDSEGSDQPSKFNLIDVIRGSLQMDGCQLQKNSYGANDTYNAVKVHRDAELIASKCEFVRSPGFAISGVAHANIDVSECGFQSNGVQMVEGPGVIRKSVFTGDFGIQVQQSGADTVQVTDCDFQSNKLYAINATDDGRLDCQSNRYTKCSTGIRVTAQNKVKAVVGDSGSIKARNETFDQCQIAAVSIHSGKVVFDDKCTISSSETAVVLAGGIFAAKNLTVSNCSKGGVLATKDAEQVGLVNASFDNCEEYAIEIENCSKTMLRDISTANCKDHAVYIGAGNASIDGLTIRGSAIGLALTDTPTIDYIGSIDIADCTYGIFCDPEEFHDLYFEIQGGRIANCSNVCIYALKRTEISLSKVKFEGVDENKLPYLAKLPAKIRVVD